MTLSSTQEIFYLVLSVASAWVAVFLCWALYELAKVLHQANTVMTETRQKITRVEHAVMKIKEKLESSVSYLGMLAEGGKSLLSFLHMSEEKKEKRRGKKHEEEEE